MTRHILLSNDDGIDAYGLQLLRRLLLELPDTRVSVVAPSGQQSASSHSLSLRKPLYLETHGEGLWSVSGTPTDCVLIANEHILKDDPPDAVFSGINHGSNMGQDVTYSGTVAAAMEGTLYGLPSYALSCTAHFPEHWDGVEAFLRAFLPRLIEVKPRESCLINVNIPDLPLSEIRGARASSLGSRKYHDVIHEGLDAAGRPCIEIRGNGPRWEDIPDTDGTLNGQGYVSLTPLNVNFTHNEMIGRLGRLDCDTRADGALHFAGDGP